MVVVGVVVRVKFLVGGNNGWVNRCSVTRVVLLRRRRGFVGTTTPRLTTGEAAVVISFADKTFTTTRETIPQDNRHSQQ